MGTTVESWEALGARIADARKATGTSQADLARELAIDRTAISKIEAGQRGVDSLELSRIARALQRPVEWFLELSPESIVSRRAARELSIDSSADLTLEQWSRDVALLIDLGTLTPPAPPRVAFEVVDVETAERAAKFVRQLLGMPVEPLANLARHAEQLGVYVLCVPMGDEKLDGSYVALGRGGATVVNGSNRTGRRRFTLAHEIGHHVLADAYSAEWIVGTPGDEHERLIDAFAIHLLMPRAGVLQRWQALTAVNDIRGAALTLAADFGVSWSAACAHLRNLDLVTDQVRAALVAEGPTKAEYVEREIAIVDDLVPPLVSPAVSAAVLKAHRKSKITRARALELLRGALTAAELQPPYPVPLDAMRSELEPLD